MLLRILWEPHISIQTTLLRAPALLCPPMRAGAGEWSELKYAVPQNLQLHAQL